MEKRKLKRIWAVVVLCYLALAGLVYLVAGQQMKYNDTESYMLTPLQNVGELTAGRELRQRIVPQGNQLRGISLFLSTYGRENSARLLVTVEDEAGRELAVQQLRAAGLTDNAPHTLTFEPFLEVTPGQTLYLSITSPDGEPGNAVTLWWGNSMTAARAEITQPLQAEDMLLVNGEPQEGKLCFILYERDRHWLGGVYWYVVAGAGVLLVLYGLYLVRCLQKGKNPVALRLLSALGQYSFLMRQLVARDFKTKYKRSVLGMLWSFLNPLLTMLVQYVVFSTLFRSDIPNFPLYLMIGIVCFNFFSESTGMCLMSIVGNANLITKVYVPKYIYPVSRTLSSMINLLLSLVPLFGVMAMTGTAATPAILLLPFGLICLLAFCIAMGLILSTSMVFFRDTQFLWGVLSMLWMYVTPIFYPESIIPQQFLLLYKCNPLYHIIRFMRTILMNGVSPEPKAYLLCFLASFIPLLIGAVVFKKNQDKFVLNL